MEYPEGCSTAMRYVVRKVAAVEGRLVWFGGDSTAGMYFQTSGLVYDKTPHNTQDVSIKKANYL